MAPLHEPDELLLGFARALRAAGVPVTQDRTRSYLEATSMVGLDDQQATYWAGRATLCSGPDDLDRYDQVFTAWFTQDHPVSRPPQDQRRRCRPRWRRGGRGGAEADEDLLNAMASEAEVLRHRDIADMAAQEKARLSALFETLDPGRRDGPPTVVRRGTGATSTPHARCGRCCGGWGSPARSSGAAARPGPGGWCC